MHEPVTNLLCAVTGCRTTTAVARRSPPLQHWRVYLWSIFSDFLIFLFSCFSFFSLSFPAA